MLLSRMMIFLLAISSASSFAMEAIRISTVLPEDNVRLVFWGKTGAGKSTTINAFYNFAKGLLYPNLLFPVKPSHRSCNVREYEGRNAENHDNGELDAVTQVASEYISKSEGNGLSLNLSMIDCPGVADPRGVEKDTEITTNIVDFLKRVGDFNAICIVLHGSTNRATPEEKYVINQIKTMTPKNSADRIFLIFTHTSRVTDNARKYAEYVGLPTKNIFAFDHFALSKEAYTENYKQDVVDDAEASWQQSKNNFWRLIDKAKKLGKYSTDEMTEIYRIKQSSSEKIEETLRKVRNIEQTEKQLKEAQANLQRAIEEQEIAANNKTSAQKAWSEAFAEKQIADALEAYETYDVKEPYNTSNYNTVCTACQVGCHIECGLENKGDYSDHLSGCNAIRDGYCTQCPNRCHYSVHRHRYVLWQTVAKSREKHGVRTRQTSASANCGVMENNLERKQKDLDKKTNNKNRLSDALETVRSYRDDLNKEKDQLQNEIVELYIELDKVSMASINFHIGEYYDLRIRNSSNADEKEKLAKDRELYIDRVERYKKIVSQN